MNLSHTPPFPALLPARPRLLGPVTARRLARSVAVYGVLVLAGLALARYGGRGWDAFGLGLILPGAGFLAQFDAPHGAMAALGLLCFGFSLLLWFATGNALAPPLTWLLAAVLAAATSRGAVADGVARGVLLLIGAGGALATGAALLRRLRAVAWRRKANLYLSGSGAALAHGFHGARGAEAAEAAEAELSQEDLQRMRFVLDRALQPLARFDGFDWLDQFQTAAVRYQLNFCGYALSMTQATYLPAFGGYLNDAQRNLIDKQTDHRIWRYWALENMWGNFSRDADPVARDNIMFTGFCAAQMAMFHAASGRRDYEAPGSFALAHPGGEAYRYDLPALIDALERAYQRSDFHLIACEPNWIYPLCNAIGAAAVKAHDRQTGGARWAARETRFRRHLEAEFIDTLARFVPCRSTYTGLALPAMGGAMAQALPCLFLNATLPDIALRQWLLLRRALFESRVATPGAATPGAAASRLRRRAFWAIDTGNYRFYRAAAYAGTALAAVEMGDAEVMARCLQALQEECPATESGGVLHRPDASVWAHAVELFARGGGRDGFRRLIERPRTTAQPSIAAARYPDVLVASAHHKNGALRAVLYPGATGRHPVGLAGLRPGALYRCDGAQEHTLTADMHGRATLHVLLQGRTPVLVRPLI